LPAAPEAVLRELRSEGVLAGLDLTGSYPELENAILV